MNQNQPIKTYQAALHYLSNQLPMFQKKGASALKKGLRNIVELDEYLGHPHQAYPCIHIAGTNGKGSTAHMLAAVFQAAGFKVGLYTSPHYRDFRERIKVDGQAAGKQFLIDFLNHMQERVRAIQPSYFELSVAMAFQYFKEQKVDLAIVETGLGGGADSTNIITPVLSIITNISYDHQNVLGDTLEEIAGHKAGIIKPKVPVVIGETQPETKAVFINKAREEQAPIIFADQHWTAELIKRALKYSTYRIFHKGKIWMDQLTSELQGDYQAKNLQTVFQSIEWANTYALFSKKIKPEHLKEGLRSLRERTNFIGRWQLLQTDPTVLIDSAHNVGGMNYAVRQLAQLEFHKLHFVLGVVKDKDLPRVLEILPKNAVYYFAKADIPRGLEAEILAGKARDYGLEGKAYAGVYEALQAAKAAAGKGDLVFVGGSIYVVAEVV